MNDFSTKFKVGASVVALGLLVGLIVLFMSITRISVGYLGVVFSPNGGVKEQTLSSGWHLVAPFDKVTEYPIRIQTVSYPDIKIATSDGKSVTIDLAYNYQVEPEKATSIFNTFGDIKAEELEQTYLKTRLRDASRKVVSKFTVIDIYGEKSSDVGVDIQEKFATDVKNLGFIVSGISVGVPQPDQKTQEAIDQRVAASQELERKNTELAIAKKEAERKFAESEGIAKSKLVEAVSQAKANKLLEQTLTPQLVQSQAIQKWNGVMSIVQGGDVNPILDMKSLTTPTETKK